MEGDVAQSAAGFPGSGEVFQEFFFHYSAWYAVDWAYNIPIVDPCASGITGTELRNNLRIERPLYLTIPSLHNAIRAELVAEYWGGHIGTSMPGFRVNGSEYLPMPDVVNTPTPKECYYRCLWGNPSAPIPLDTLREGVNEFRFAAGPQVKFNFEAGFYWLYCFGVRIYYDPVISHPTGQIIYPQPGQALGDQQVFEAQVTPGELPITQVDFIGNYEDFNWSGNGLWRDWHLQYRYGTLTRHIGSAFFYPWRVGWQSHWVPDQDQSFQVMARVRDAAGMMSMTPVVDGVTLTRQDRSIRMYTPTDVPENFGSRLGQKKTCKIYIQDELKDIYAVRLVLSTWCGGHNGNIYLNDQLVVPVLGKIHDVSFDSLDVPPSYIRQGENTFAVVSETDEHAVEINWPGPVLLVQRNCQMPGLNTPRSIGL
jgi:hypothetical protein